MFVVIVESQVDAEERSGRTAYLAKFEYGAGGAVGEVPGLEVLNHENRRALAMLARPNELFLARRWWRIGNEDGGGEVLFTVDHHGNVIPLEHSEAEALLVDGGARSLATLGRRTPPGNVFCRPTSLSGQYVRAPLK
ncbi:hypothetical protein RX327_32260 [Bradyrhizobium sp. BEA-2-5]|uniref:hypothetical protein n=1 Tax=Bradyrhizobium sp. BEA-2-5 TaxID=3080015 RepID=UPI00293F1969|nr:hypothetical protein [Bradyrhizobium sp. BEA-2-5]WOH80422.1 hypothetical protein RX327_32260 [Bradyrhizobium sp. BEA-2-5]